MAGLDPMGIRISGWPGRIVRRTDARHVMAGLDPAIYRGTAAA
jgi:hypothetical protein